jgi:hypothetical protein
MESKRWGMRLAGASIWAVAALTWGSIAHHLWGFPDVGVVVAIVSVALVLALPLQRTERAANGTITPALLDRRG